VAVAHEQVAALLRRVLPLFAEPHIVDDLEAGVHPDAPAAAIDERKLPVAAMARVVKLGLFAGASGFSPEETCRGVVIVRPAASCRARRDRGPGAVARVDEPLRAKDLERLTIHAVAIALASVAPPRAELVRWMDVCVEAKPVEVVENARLELRPRARPVVIFDPQQHTAIDRAGDLPDVVGVQHVPQVQPSGRRRREARDRPGGQTGDERRQVRVHITLSWGPPPPRANVPSALRRDLAVAGRPKSPRPAEAGIPTTCHASRSLGAAVIFLLVTGPDSRGEARIC
jgi:hypothetical protein